MAFRITLQATGDAATVVRLEGRLGEADLPVLESCLGELGGAAYGLDLAELRWLAPAAVDRLSELLREGATLVASSPFVDRLLVRSDADSPPPRGAATHAADSHGP